MTALDEIPSPPPSPYRWAEDVRVVKRGTPGPAWTVESQDGCLVRVYRDTPHGRLTTHFDWSELVEERHAAAGRAEAAKHVRVARPLARPAALEVDSERGEL